MMTEYPAEAQQLIRLVSLPEFFPVIHVVYIRIISLNLEHDDRIYG